MKILFPVTLIVSVVKSVLKTGFLGYVNVKGTFCFANIMGTFIFVCSLNVLKKLDDRPIKTFRGRKHCIINV